MFCTHRHTDAHKKEYDNENIAKYNLLFWLKSVGNCLLFLQFIWKFEILHIKKVNFSMTTLLEVACPQPPGTL